MATAAITINQLNIQHTTIELIGEAPLIMHQWSEKAKSAMRDKQQKRASKAKEAKDPDAEMKAATYFLSDAEANRHGTIYGFPSVAFKSAAVSACRSCDMKMTEARALFHVAGELSPIYGEPVMREDTVRIGMGTADLRYRPMFDQWKATVEISFNADVLSLEQLLNLFNIAGFSTGIGEWRPEKNGQYGRFRVATENDQ